MRKKAIITIIISLFCVFLLLTSLVFFAKMPNQKNNGFLRIWMPNKIVQLDVNNTELPIKRISGHTSTYFFFSGTNPNWVLQTTNKLNIQDTLLFSVEPTQKLLANNIIIDSPYAYIYANNISFLITARIDSSYIDTIRLHTSIFTRSVQISPKSVVIRGLDSTHQQQVFKKIDCVTGKVLKEALIVEDKHDGGFSTDGILQYDTLTKKLIYIQMYQNNFFCIDTNLQITYIGKTIDTVQTNDIVIKQVQIGNETKLMPATSRETVNLRACTNNGYLFIASGLRADNEKLSDFNKNTVIDIYNISNGSYKGSFYLPNYKGKKAIDLLINNGLLVALYHEGHMVTFQIEALKNLN